MTWLGWVYIFAYAWSIGKAMVDAADKKISDDKLLATVVLSLLMAVLILTVGTGTGI